MHARNRYGFQAAAWNYLVCDSVRALCITPTTRTPSVTHMRVTAAELSGFGACCETIVPRVRLPKDQPTDGSNFAAMEVAACTALAKRAPTRAALLFLLCTASYSLEYFRTNSHARLVPANAADITLTMGRFLLGPVVNTKTTA